ncbi:MAG: SagB/ThcOx family dehydrogenase [Thermodesulfovibrionales bacterium]
MPGKRLEQYRSFLKDRIRLETDFSATGQSRGIPPPPAEKPFSPGAKRISLIAKADWKSIQPVSLIEAIAARQSHRHFRNEPLSLEELSFLLWATQGLRKKAEHGTAFRTVPSAGCRHALETYLCVMNITDLDSGLYRYLPFSHELVLERPEPDIREKVAIAALGQTFVGLAAVTFIWTAIPSRMEWRYGLASHKVIALDAGHVCQNLYLACAAVRAGTCAVAAYHQDLMDELLGVDGTEEFAIYLAPVGRI